MLSMVNTNWIAKGVEPVVFGVALMFSGITQLIAGIIQLRNGNTFAVLSQGFGAFWMSLFANVQWFLKAVQRLRSDMPKACSCTRWIFIVIMLLTSLRTDGGGGAGGFYDLFPRRRQLRAEQRLIHWAGYGGLAAAACAFYLALAELSDSSYGRAVVPVWPLAKH